MSNLQKGSGAARGSLFRGQPIEEVRIEEVAFAHGPLNKKVFHLMMEKGGTMLKELIAKIKAGEVKVSDLFAMFKAEGVELPPDPELEAKLKADADAKAKADADAKLKADADAKAKAAGIPPEVQARLDKLEADGKRDRETIASMLLEKKQSEVQAKIAGLHIAMDPKKLTDLYVAMEATGQLPAFEELLASYDAAVKFMFDKKGLPAGEANTEQAALKKLTDLAAEKKITLMDAARANPQLAMEAGMVPQVKGR